YPEDDDLRMVEVLGQLITALESRLPWPAEGGSARRFEALAAAMHAGPRQVLRALGPSLRGGQDDEAERLVVRLLEAVPDDPGAAITGMMALSAATCERLFLGHVRGRDEEIRYQVFRHLARNTRLPEPGSISAHLSREGTMTLLRLGLADTSPRV